MRITVRLSDTLGRELKARTENVSGYVAEALKEKIERERRNEARRTLLSFAGTGLNEPALPPLNQEERRTGNRVVSEEDAPNP